MEAETVKSKQKADQKQEQKLQSGVDVERKLKGISEMKNGSKNLGSKMKAKRKDAKLQSNMRVERENRK